MMKKIVLSILILWLLLSVSVYAENGVKYVDTKIDSRKINEANADLSQIEINFCDKAGEKGIEYSIAPGWIQDICLQASNISDKDIEIHVEFVDGSITNDQRQNKACLQQWQNKIFWQYVTGFSSSFIVPANNVFFQHAKIYLPKWSQWIIYWCLVYYTKSVEMWGGINFSVLMRKAKFIDVKVRENIFIKKYSVWIVGILLFLYLTKRVIFSKNTKKTTKK